MHLLNRSFGVIFRVSLLPLLLLSGAGPSWAHDATAAQVNPAPLVNAPLVPDNAAPGGADFKLTVNGTGFVSGSVVQWNGNSLTSQFVSSSQLTATVPAADIALPGTASVSVRSPSPGGGNSNSTLFTVRQPFSASSFGLSLLPTAAEPWFPIAADFNGDGKPDLAAIEDGKPAVVAVFLNAGNGTFEPAVEYAIGNFYGILIVGDFNSDGALDIAVSDGSGSVSVLLGNGDGTFQLRKNSNTELSAGDLAAGDFNKDGKLDLAMAFPGPSSKLLILAGNGDGTFQAPVEYDVGSDRAFNVVVGDFSGDGNEDIAVTVDSGFVAVFLGKEDGTFQDAVLYAVPLSPYSITSADLNGDGRLDLVVRLDLNHGLSILLGNGDGTFAAPRTYLVGASLYGLAAADVNGDGILDLVLPNSSTRKSDSTVTAFLGKGDGTFGRRSDFPAGRLPTGMAVADFDGDGLLDLVTTSYDNSLSILPQVTSVLSQTYMKFGKVKVGNSATRNVTLTNIGGAAEAVGHIKLVGKGTDAFHVSDNCGSKLGPGSSCKITIVFQPTYHGTFNKAQVKVNDSIAVQKIYLYGNGTN